MTGLQGLGVAVTGFVGVGAARVIGMALLAAIVAAPVAAGYRGLLGERAPAIYPLLVGLGAVGVWLNTASALIAVVGSEPMVLERATTNALALAAGGLGAVVGAQIGDAAAPNVLALTGRRDLDREVSRVVKTVGRFTTVRLPKRIDDIEGDEPVLAGKKEALAGRELVFPRGLTVSQLRTRLIERLKRDYGIGHVDVEVTEAGEVTHLALGRRVAGVGATLPPRTAAIAVEADPGFDASPDDRVQIWERGEEGYRRVATGDVRAVDGDDVTLALETSRARQLDQTASHRLVTLPTGGRPDREFAALLRAANETMGAVTVRGGSVLDGAPVGALRPPVIALRADGEITTLPHRDRVLRASDVIYVIGRRDELRRVREAAGE
ncbi:MAG: hypothetical protein ABEJ74_03910 [Haloferacaceae archaeon]